MLPQKYTCLQEMQLAAAPPDMDPSYMKFEKLKIHDTKEHNEIYKRIKIVAELLRQFSMTTGIKHVQTEEKPNYNYYYHVTHNYQRRKKKIKATHRLLKFVSLLLHCDDVTFNQLGLDILSNTAPKLAKLVDHSDHPTCSKLIDMFYKYCIEHIIEEDGDIYNVKRSIEVVTRLISSSNRQVSSNMINLFVEKNIVARLEQLLTSQHDVTLFLAALECCFKISACQVYLLTSEKSKYLVKILINLLNCEAHGFFSPIALKRIKLVDEEYEDSQDNFIPIYPPAQEPVRKIALPSKDTTQIVHRKVNAKPVVSQVDDPKTVENKPENDKAANHVSNGIKNLVDDKKDNTSPVTDCINEIKTSIEKNQYRCEWDGCAFSSSKPELVYSHVFDEHIKPLPCDSLTPCSWSGPNGSGPGCLTKRPKYSLMTHLEDFHCNATTQPQPSIKPPEFPGYAPNAAYVAIRRHASMDNANNKGIPFQSPLSVSVRLTSASILRNLASSSPEIKQTLKIYESFLSEICMSKSRDESKIVAECLSLFSTD